MESWEVWLEASKQITAICEKFVEFGERWTVEVPETIKSGELTVEQMKEWHKHMCSMQQNTVKVQQIAETIQDVTRQLIPQLETRIVKLIGKRAQEEAEKRAKEEMKKFWLEEKEKLDQSRRKFDEDRKRKEEEDEIYDEIDSIRIKQLDITGPITKECVEPRRIKNKRRSRSVSKVANVAKFVMRSWSRTATERRNEKKDMEHTGTITDKMAAAYLPLALTRNAGRPTQPPRGAPMKITMSSDQLLSALADSKKNEKAPRSLQEEKTLMDKTKKLEAEERTDVEGKKKGDFEGKLMERKKVVGENAKMNMMMKKDGEKIELKKSILATNPVPSAASTRSVVTATAQAAGSRLRPPLKKIDNK